MVLVSMHPKIDKEKVTFLINQGFFLKKMGGGLTSVVQYYFDKEVQTSIMSNPKC